MADDAQMKASLQARHGPLTEALLRAQGAGNEALLRGTEALLRSIDTHTDRTLHLISSVHQAAWAGGAMLDKDRVSPRRVAGTGAVSSNIRTTQVLYAITLRALFCTCTSLP